LTSEQSLFSHVMIIKQRYLFSDFPDGPLGFNEICNSLLKSRNFRELTYPSKEVFSEHFREQGEIYRTFEMAEPIEIVNINLIETELSGKLRLLVTIYRTGFLVLSFVHSVIPKKKEGQPTGKNLISGKPLNPVDIIFLLEEQIPGYGKPLAYEVILEEKENEMKLQELAEYLIKILNSHGIKVRRKPSSNANIIHCWNPNISVEFSKILEKNYKDLFLILTTPQSVQSIEPKEEILKKLKSYIFFDSKNRGGFFRRNSMLLVSPVKRKPSHLLSTQLPWIFQLASMQYFLLQFYSREIRRITPKISISSSTKPADLLSQVLKLSSDFSLCLEDLYWVEYDLFRLQSAHFISEYKKQFRLDERLATLQRRFRWIEERCTEARVAHQHRIEREREKSIAYLTLIFATFGLGEILSSFTIWYFVYLQSNAHPIPQDLLTIGLILPFLAMLILYLISRQYISHKYKIS